MTKGKIEYKKNHKRITPHQCLSRTRVNRVKIIQESKIVYKHPKINNKKNVSK